MKTAHRHLVTGGARAGKSTFALRVAETLRGEDSVAFIATARATDDDMAARIARHRAERGPHFVTVEEPVALPLAVRQASARHRVTVVDCLTVWVANVMFEGVEADAAEVHRRFDDLEGAIRCSAGHVVVVTNEVGLSVHPEHAVSRRYVDHLGRLNQRIAAACDRVTLVVAGIALPIKGL